MEAGPRIIPGYVQDAPRPGGYPLFSLAQRKGFPRRGPKGWVLYVAYAGGLFYTHYLLSWYGWNSRKLNYEVSTVHEELIPYLQAEEGRRYLRNRREWKQVEAAIMEEKINKGEWDLDADEKSWKTRWERPAPPLFGW